MRDLFIEIWESIRRNKLRTVLTGLAVSWGIFMLIVLLGAGNGVLNATVNSSDDLATNVMSIWPGYTSKPYDGLKQGRYVELTVKDVELTASETFGDVIDDVSAMLYQGGMTVTYGKRHFGVSMVGVYPEYANMHMVDMHAGRFIDKEDMDQCRKVAILSHMQAKNFLSGSTDYEKLIGKRVVIDGLSYLVIGVRHGAENNNDTDLYVPFTTMRTVMNKGQFLSRLSFTFHGLPTEEANEAFEKKYKAVINRAHRAAPDDESALWISNRFTSNMQLQKAVTILKTALWIIGLFTLLGGIVGVSNIMLITVKERTHEFGIRKAIGAGPGSIIKLIISESVAITAFFGYVGMILGLVGCELLDKTLGHSKVDIFGQSAQIFENPSVSVGTAIGVTLVLIIAGTIAGLIPALKAAKVRPIEALNAN